jgi:hypothetical protein
LLCCSTGRDRVCSHCGHRCRTCFGQCEVSVASLILGACDCQCDGMKAIYGCNSARPWHIEIVDLPDLQMVIFPVRYPIVFQRLILKAIEFWDHFEVHHKITIKSHNITINSPSNSTRFHKITIKSPWNPITSPWYPPDLSRRSERTCDSAAPRSCPSRGNDDPSLWQGPGNHHCIWMCYRKLGFEWTLCDRMISIYIYNYMDFIMLSIYFTFHF